MRYLRREWCAKNRARLKAKIERTAYESGARLNRWDIENILESIERTYSDKEPVFEMITVSVFTDPDDFYEQVTADLSPEDVDFQIVYENEQDELLRYAISDRDECYRFDFEVEEVTATMSCYRYDSSEHSSEAGERECNTVSNRCASRTQFKTREDADASASDIDETAKPYMAAPSAPIMGDDDEVYFYSLAIYAPEETEEDD